MRCIACNRLLSDFEATRKSKVTGEYPDLCSKCFDPIRKDVEVYERLDLMTEEDVENDFEGESWEDLNFDE